MWTNIILTLSQVLAISVVPIIVWQLQKKYQDRKSKRDAKLNLFLTLMANRKSNPITKEWADALNTIDVIFQEDKKVRSSWRAYYDSLHPDSQHRANTNSFLLDLLSEIANNLGYQNLKQTEIDRFYIPQYFGSQMTRQDLLFQEHLRVLMNSKSYAETFPLEEYQDHYKTVFDNRNS